MREEFPQNIKELLAKRVGYRCANPGCRQPTSGPQIDPQRALNVGVAAHISAAASGGPRYSPSLTSEQRASVDNGIWLCQTCAKLVDNDEQRYTEEVLRGWRREAESVALKEVETGRTHAAHPAPQPDSKTDVILKYRGKEVRLEWMNSGRNVRLLGPVASYAYLTVVDCDQFAVTLRRWDSTQVIPLTRVDLAPNLATGDLILQIREP
jgi:hypothetical protein